MRFSNQELTLWYGTPDAPAPVENTVQARRGISVTIAAQPASLSNSVSVSYRVNDGLVQSIQATRLQTDYLRGVDYFRAFFPHFSTGERVTYLPVLTNNERTVPHNTNTRAFPSSFRLGDDSSDAQNHHADGRRQPTDLEHPNERLPFSMDYLATVHIPLNSPEIIGVTPEGIMVNWFWYPAEGVVKGPRLNAKVRQIGGDWMTIRRDGVGVMDVRATLETNDGAMLFVHYLGHYELGENGYQDFLDRRWPTRAPTRTTPRFHTGHPRYLWLNRLQCIGIGEVRMIESAYIYDLYAVR
jgi:hypothetical protein